jgi:hypothetical protein
MLNSEEPLSSPVTYPSGLQVGCVERAGYKRRAAFLEAWGTHGLLVPSVVVVVAADVVLAGVCAVLYLDDNQFLLTLIAEAMFGALWHVHRFTGASHDHCIVNNARCDAENYDPVLATVLVGLIRQTAPSINMNPLDLVAVIHIDDVPGAPRPLLRF